ncbi:ribonuclease HI [Trypanosoma cruzi]|nr:ribonuclease HI [Trypanosoma cruzi]
MSRVRGIRALGSPVLDCERLHEPTPFPQHLTGTLCLYALQRRSHCTGTEAVPPTTREADAPPVERRPSTRRRKRKCPHCDATLVGHTNHISHCRCLHPERPPPLPNLHRDCCNTVFPTQKKLRTDIAAHKTQTLIGTAAAVPGGNHCYRRISQPPQAQQLARRKHCTICFQNVQTLWLCANGWALRRTFAPKGSPNGSCLVAGNSCRCSTTSSASW